jgi:phage tail-like protein
MLEIQNIVQAGFSECTGFDTTSDVVEYREGNEPLSSMRKFPGSTKYANITLKWGVTDSSESKQLWDWRKMVIDGDMKQARRNGAIIVLDEQGNEKIRWDFINGWPSKYDPSDLNAKGNDVAIDMLEITHEGIERSK